METTGVRRRGTGPGWDVLARKASPGERGKLWPHGAAGQGAHVYLSPEPYLTWQAAQMGMRLRFRVADLPRGTVRLKPQSLDVPSVDLPTTPPYQTHNDKPALTGWFGFVSVCQEGREGRPFSSPGQLS